MVRSAQALVYIFSCCCGPPIAVRSVTVPYIVNHDVEHSTYITRVASFGSDCPNVLYDFYPLCHKQDGAFPSTHLNKRQLTTPGSHSHTFFARYNRLVVYEITSSCLRIHVIHTMFIEVPSATLIIVGATDTIIQFTFIIRTVHFARS